MLGLEMRQYMDNFTERVPKQQWTTPPQSSGVGELTLVRLWRIKVKLFLKKADKESEGVLNPEITKSNI